MKSVFRDIVKKGDLWISKHERRRPRYVTFKYERGKPRYVTGRVVNVHAEAKQRLREWADEIRNRRNKTSEKQSENK